MSGQWKRLFRTYGMKNQIPQLRLTLQRVLLYWWKIFCMVKVKKVRVPKILQLWWPLPRHRKCTFCKRHFVWQNSTTLEICRTKDHTSYNQWNDFNFNNCSCVTRSQIGYVQLPNGNVVLVTQSDSNTTTTTTTKQAAQKRIWEAEYERFHIIAVKGGKPVCDLSRKGWTDK